MIRLYSIFLILTIYIFTTISFCSSSNKPPRGDSPGENKIIKIANDVHGGISVSQDEGRFFRMITESTNAKNIVEIGTYNGYSGLWFALGLKKTGGKLTTYEIDPERAEKAQKNFDRAGVADIVTIIIGNAHDEVTKLKDTGNVLLDISKQVLNREQNGEEG